MIQAFVGSGGKTTLIKKYVSYYRSLEKKVFVTTSTKMYIEKDTLLTDDPNEIIASLEENGYVMAGISNGIKMTSLSYDTYIKVCEHADVVLVEADGSKHMPVKYPNEYEPVIYDNIQDIIVVVGLQALGNRLIDVSHRPELVKKCLGVTDDCILQPFHIQKIMQKGYVEPLKEKYPDKNILIEPNHDGSLYQRAIAALLKAGMDTSIVNQSWFMPQPSLIICGGGHISSELVKIASCLDFKIIVIDDREEFANKNRFPLADEVFFDSFDNLEMYLEPNAYYVIVSRGHKYDYICAKTILEHSYQYVGMIGSKRKVQSNIESLKKAGITEQQIATMHAPIGLKIGAVTPAEIAVSIMAEIIQEKNKMQQASASRELLSITERGILCIIIEKAGSSPRGVGSMMFVNEKMVIDSIGGGAIEFAVIQDAKNITRPTIREYDLSNQDVADLGMICGGKNKVLFLPI